MMIFASLCLLLFWILPADSQEIPLGMVDDAVDDMYFGCEEKMAKLLKDKYFRKEIKGEFEKAWETAGNRNDILSRIVDGFIRMFTREKALTTDHKKAITVYTEKKEDWYRQLNDKVRSGRADYGTDNFPFHYFHFWLTSAIQSLNKKDAKCFTSYRKNNLSFIGQVQQKIRFGSFASSSLSTKLKNFGNKTCFKINTCLGASLAGHSEYPDEEEVLIPPYEMFTITQKIQGESVKSVEGLTDCELVYVVEAAGVHSNLNCKLS